jgi:hypothetical protein
MPESGTSGSVGAPGRQRLGATRPPDALWSGNSPRHPDADAIAGDARLGDLEKGVTNLISIADARGIVGEPLDREVLAELPVYEVRSLQLSLPVPIRLELVDQNGALLTPVRGEITLTVPVDIQSTNETAPRHGCLPGASVYGPPLPPEAAWRYYAYRSRRATSLTSHR